MSAKTRLARMLIGVVAVLTVIAAGFAITLGWIHTWGATPAEVAQVYPGDELAPSPAVAWTHAVDIAAPAEQVWPWIAQIGDNRGGFYSYTFIERLFPGSKDLYHNATMIHPEWQNLAPGQGLIMDLLKIQMVQPGHSMLTTANAPGLTWVWLWQVEPRGAQASRMVIRMRIQVDGAGLNPILTGVIDLGGFVMERGMVQGIQERAEGRVPPAYAEPTGIALWLIALLAGLACAYLFVARQRWQRPLVMGLLAIVVLFVLTFVQPALLVRLALDVVLITGVVWAAWQPGKVGPITARQNS